MKIGAFAKKFGLNISRVRYYVTNGLLTPNKKEGHYEFGKECVSDMENIIKYKKYHFSLEEIQLLFFMEKASQFQDEIVIEVCADMLQKKRSQLIAEKENLSEFINDLEKEIGDLSFCTSEGKKEGGIPFSYIPYLYCPDCQKPLKIEAANLSNGAIQKGDLGCDCGYQVGISDGIILCQNFVEETPFKAFDNIDSVMSMKDQFSPNYRMLIKKAYIWMYNSITNRPTEPRHILAGPFTLNFLFEYIEKLGMDNTYIIFDPSLTRIEKIRKYLSNRNYNVVYIVGNSDRLPVKNKSIDIYIDDYSTVNSLFTYNSFFTKHLAHLMKVTGEVVGIFTSYQNAPKSLYNFKELQPNFDTKRMTLSALKYEWGLEGIQVFCDKKIGSTNPGEVHFFQNEPGEQVEVRVYAAKKSTNRAK